MTIHLTHEQEQRIQAVIQSGAYRTVDDVVEAALNAVEQCGATHFDGTDEELEGLLVAGLNSPELEESEFWSSVDRATNAMLVEQKDIVHP